MLLLLNYLLELMVLTYLSISVEELLIHGTSWDLPVEVEKQSLLPLLILLIDVAAVVSPRHREQIKARGPLFLRLNVVKEKASQRARCLRLLCLSRSLRLDQALSQPVSLLGASERVLTIVLVHHLVVVEATVSCHLVCIEVKLILGEP